MSFYHFLTSVLATHNNLQGVVVVYIQPYTCFFTRRCTKRGVPRSQCQNLGYGWHVSIPQLYRTDCSTQTTIFCVWLVDLRKNENVVKIPENVCAIPLKFVHFLKSKQIFSYNLKGPCFIEFHVNKEKGCMYARLLKKVLYKVIKEAEHRSAQLHRVKFIIYIFLSKFSSHDNFN